MSKIKKLAAVLLSAVMFVCCFSVQASADSIEDTAKSISNGKSYSTQLYNYEDHADYKINATKSGTLKIKISSAKISSTYIYVYDSDGNDVKLSEKSVSSGNANYRSYGGCTICDWKDTVEKFVGTLSYSIKKGTYYIRFTRYSGSGSGKITFSATFPSSSSSSGKITGIAVPMKVNGTMQLAAAGASGTSGTVTWSSSDKSVASVSSNGKVTAKKKGIAVITAKLGSSSASIVINVT